MPLFYRKVMFAHRMVLVTACKSKARCLSLFEAFFKTIIPIYFRLFRATVMQYINNTNIGGRVAI